MKNQNGVVLNLLAPATIADNKNILMDVDEKYTGITHMALTVSPIADAKAFMANHNIEITGSFGFGSMSAIFVRDPDRNVIELDAYNIDTDDNVGDYSNHI